MLTPSDSTKPPEMLPTICLCMIVRNESTILPRFLESTTGAWDQLVAVDTGSQDDSREILRAGGAEVVDMAWQDDFSLARNESLRHARTDWILILDADEFPERGFADELRTLTTKESVGAANILLRGPQRNGSVRHNRLLRIFRRSADIRFRCRIHEDATDGIVTMLKRRGQSLEQMRTPVLHIGYTPDRLAQTKKRERDERLLRMAIGEDANDLYSRYKLLEQFRFWGDTAAGVATANECLRLITQKGITVHPPHIAGDLIELIHSTLFASRPREGLDFLTSMEPIAGHTGRYRLTLGMCFEKLDGLEDAFRQYSQALMLVAVDPERQLIETRALCGLARLSLAIADMASAREFATVAVAVSPEDEEAIALNKLLAPG